MPVALHTFKSGDVARYQGGDIKWRVETESFAHLVMLVGPKLSRTMSPVEASEKLLHVWPSDGQIRMPDRLHEVDTYIRDRPIHGGYIADPFHESLDNRSLVARLNRGREFPRPTIAQMAEVDAHGHFTHSGEEYLGGPVDFDRDRKRAETLVAELEQLEVGKPETFHAAEDALLEARVEAMMRYAADPSRANWATRAALNVAIEEMRRVKGLFS